MPLMSNEGDLEQAVELRSTEPGWGVGGSKSHCSLTGEN